MEKKTLGILALAVIGLFGVSAVMAVPFGNSNNGYAMMGGNGYANMMSEDSFEYMNKMMSPENYEIMGQMHNYMFGAEVENVEAVESFIDEMGEYMPMMRQGSFRNHMGSGMGYNMMSING